MMTSSLCTHSKSCPCFFFHRDLFRDLNRVLSSVTASEIVSSMIFLFEKHAFPFSFGPDLMPETDVQKRSIKKVTDSSVS